MFYYVDFVKPGKTNFMVRHLTTATQTKNRNKILFNESASKSPILEEEPTCYVHSMLSGIRNEPINQCKYLYKH